MTKYIAKIHRTGAWIAFEARTERSAKIQASVWHTEYYPMILYLDLESDTAAVARKEHGRWTDL